VSNEPILRVLEIDRNLSFLNFRDGEDDYTITIPVQNFDKKFRKPASHRWCLALVGRVICERLANNNPFKLKKNSKIDRFGLILIDNEVLG